MKKKIQNKLGTYLAVTAGVGCASSVANAAVVFYGNASNTNIEADPNGINFNTRFVTDPKSGDELEIREIVNEATIVEAQAMFPILLRVVGI